MDVSHSPAFLTVSEVATRYKMSASTIYRMLRRREIPAFKMGSDWRFSVEELEKWEQSRTAR